jgi:hypothetical protein
VNPTLSNKTSSLPSAGHSLIARLISSRSHSAPCRVSAFSQEPYYGPSERGVAPSELNYGQTLRQGWLHMHSSVRVVQVAKMIEDDHAGVFSSATDLNSPETEGVESMRGRVVVVLAATSSSG